MIVAAELTIVPELKIVTDIIPTFMLLKFIYVVNIVQKKGNVKRRWDEFLGKMGGIERAGVLEYSEVGQVRRVGQVGHYGWYAVCQLTTKEIEVLACGGDNAVW